MGQLADSPAVRSERPAMAYSLLEKRATFGVVAVLLLLGAGGWLLTVRQSFDMTGMATGLGQIGVNMPAGLTVPLFMAMWISMMVAMMFPAVAPVVLAHRMVVLQRGEGWVPTATFLLGYLVVCSAAGAHPGKEPACGRAGLRSVLSWSTISAEGGVRRCVPESPMAPTASAAAGR